jgi:hypothetical protein
MRFAPRSSADNAFNLVRPPAQTCEYYHGNSCAHTPVFFVCRLFIFVGSRNGRYRRSHYRKPVHPTMASAMLTRFTCLMRHLLACWLVVMASGDDFNFARVAFPLLSSSSTTNVLPLDDPNSDFTEPNAAKSSPRTGKKRFKELSSFFLMDRSSRLVFAAHRSRFSDSSFGRENLPLPHIFTCLRC